MHNKKKSPILDAFFYHRLFLLLFFCLLSFLNFHDRVFASQANNEVNLIYQSLDTSYIWEIDWIEELLSNVSFKKFDDRNYETILDHAVIVVGPTFDPNLQLYLNKFKEKNYKFGIIHLSDENYNHPTHIYANAQFVLRNYWHKKFLDQKNVYSFPLGYKQGFWKNSSKEKIKAVWERKYTWSFAGQIKKSTRQHMIGWMKQIPHHFIYEISTFGDPNSLLVEDYKNLLLESVFVPCPRGFWNLDSFRICEALECGCIPIVEKSPFDYFAKLFGNYPFLAVENWDAAPSLINELLSDPVRLEKMRSECYEWWLIDKKKRKKRIAKIIEQSFYTK